MDKSLKSQGHELIPCEYSSMKICRFILLHTDTHRWRGQGLTMLVCGDLVDISMLKEDSVTFKITLKCL